MILCPQEYNIQQGKMQGLFVARPGSVNYCERQPALQAPSLSDENIHKLWLGASKIEEVGALPDMLC